ncbi:MULTISPECIES: hypothetical protein [unclassified Frondihabitans]|uniref:hypothetical protein n=1 Tax=unclassified Frondihabitans TaxID=2626248 RepID=UPI000F4EB1F9|nr:MULTISPECIES: hypothetical protein [unclassified Frondihabitans]RPE78301.1 hypothetical protein EDF37_0974 [Frondihabitans sp. PhB153]RPF08582.1 hypothetical protein EDF39_0976 [Frondihabitans sp. PhB161]
MTLAHQLARFELILSSIDPALLASFAPGLDDAGVESLREQIAPRILSPQLEILYRWRSGGPLPLFFGRALRSPALIAAHESADDEARVDGVAAFTVALEPRHRDLCVLLDDLTEAAESAGSGAHARRTALTSAAPPAHEPPGIPDEATHTVEELVSASETTDVVGTVEGRITDLWSATGYAEYRLADTSGTLVIGMRDLKSAPATGLGDDVVMTVRIRKGAAAITEPIDPRRPSILGAVPAEYLAYRVA